MPQIIRLIDRTRTIQDWKCARSRFWGYEYLGRGIVKNGNSLELFLGITIHDALAAIATQARDGVDVDIDTIADLAFKQVYDELVPDGLVEYSALEFAKEQGSLVEGIVRGFYHHVWPRLMAMYPVIVAVETEMEYPLDEFFTFMTRPDLVMEDLEGNLVYIEFKSTSSKKESWINSWDTQVQLHSSVKATEITLGRTVTGVQIIGLYKGYESYGKQSSPFCYAYKRAGNPPFTQDQIEYKYKAGFRRSATWEMAGGVKKWVENMPENILADQFALTPVINVNDDLVESFWRQRTHRETEIRDAMLKLETADEDEEREVMDAVFPQRFDQCQPSFGWACQFKKLCHGFVSEPLLEGYSLREPHHDQERAHLGLDSGQV